jgi:glycosyltransferase involved in cell wall biosynthesis
MRVALSLLTLAPGRVGGSETYTRALCRALAEVGRGEYEVLVPRIAQDAGEGLPTRVIGAYKGGRGMPGRLLSMVSACVLPRVRRELALAAFDVVHFPLTVMIPPIEAPPAVVTMHDVQHLVMPHFFSRSTLLYRRLVYGWTARRARLVIAISAHVAGTLVERLGVPEENVLVVYSGIDHTRFTPPPRESAREPFLLYPAYAWRHKNHARLLEAFALLRRRHPDLRLVLTGPGHRQLPPESGVEVRGFVQADELVRLYRTAAAMVFPSLYEGFGQPLLEAMACGCPVAASDAASIPEVCGGAARLFDPNDAEAIADAVDDVLAGPAVWSQRGLERAAAFSWERTARETDDVYARLA